MTEHAARRGLFERTKADTARAVMETETDEVSFLYQGFCHVGLPLRKPKGDGMWSRHDGTFGLTIRPEETTLPDGSLFRVGVPYGPKARLLVMWLATELQAPGRSADDPWVEFGRITEWLRAVGIEPRGGERGAIKPTKEQLVRLTFANFSLTARGGDAIWFRNESIVETKGFRHEDLELYRSGRVSAMGWPLGIQLTERALGRFQLVQPVATNRLRAVADNAMAIDVFSYLANALPRIQPGATHVLTWQQLMHQFGASGWVSRFRRDYGHAIHKALAAYPEADIEEAEDGSGILMRRSDPPIPRQPTVSVMGARRPRLPLFEQATAEGAM